jgi:predicted nuclease of predicted toxin-antitoxin system
MKLLLDENLSRRIVPFIQDNYPGSTQVTLVGLERASDKAIREYAVENDFVIVTKDADFYDMNLVFGQPPKIIWLRTGNQTKAETVNTLIANQSVIDHSLVMDDEICIEII